VKWTRTAAVFAAYGTWRATGASSAGRVVARALAADDETQRTSAGMLLVKSGERALPLLRDNLERGVAVAMTLRVLADIGGAAADALRAEHAARQPTQ
jgi:hypothetical protein